MAPNPPARPARDLVGSSCVSGGLGCGARLCLLGCGNRCLLLFERSLLGEVLLRDRSGHLVPTIAPNERMMNNTKIRSPPAAAQSWRPKMSAKIRMKIQIVTKMK